MNELIDSQQATSGDRPVWIDLPYGTTTISCVVPARNLAGVFSPRVTGNLPVMEQEFRRALASPIGVPPLRQAARGARRVVIVADDLTRATPVDRMIPLVLDELNAAEISDDQVTVLIALGTHRPMTDGEIQARFGESVTRRVTVINNPWQDARQMVKLGETSNGTPVSISRYALQADYLIGLGSIVPHHIPGFSAGAKIIQPGITGAETTGATHYLSTRTSGSYLGQLENPVRAEMEDIARRAGLKAVFNVVLNPGGEVVRAVFGDFRDAFRQGVAAARQVYGIEIARKADIVIANAHPCEIEFWQSHKALYPAEIAVKPGGRIIITTPCPEGVSVMHPDILDFTALSSQQIDACLQDGTIRDMVSGALALAWAKVREKARVSLVSEGISAEETRALGFDYFSSLQDALDAAMVEMGSNAMVTVLTHAPDMLPTIGNRK